MDNSSYQSLIDDTIDYLKTLLPKKDKKEIHITKKNIDPPLNIKKSSSSPYLTSVKELPNDQSPHSNKKETTNTIFKLEPPSLPPKEPTEKFRKLLQEIDPHLFLHKNPPSDSAAKRIKESWKDKRDTPSVSILYHDTKYQIFLENIAKAINVTFGTCRLTRAEKNKKWDLFLDSPKIKAILAPDNLIFENSELRIFYKENPQKKTHKLGNIPLLLLPDLSLYQKDPYLKRSLWNVIIKNLQPLF